MNSRPGGSKENEEEDVINLKRKIARLEAEKEEAKRMLETEKQEAKKPKIFEDFILENETFEISVKRRLGYFYRKKDKEVQDSINNICKEIGTFIPEDVKKFVVSLKGNDWPNAGKPCLDYNAKACESGWIHHQRAQKGRNDFSCMHLCAICIKIHQIGLYHPAIECPTIKFIDDKIAKEKMWIDDEKIPE